MRRASCRSVPMMCRPPSSLDFARPSAFICSRSSISRTRASHSCGGTSSRVGYLSCKLGPGHRFGIAAQDDVGAAAGHVRGDGHGALAAGLGDDFGLALVMLGVEHFVRNAAPLEHASRAVRSFRSTRCRPASAGRCCWISLDLVAGIRFLLCGGSRRLELDRRRPFRATIVPMQFVSSVSSTTSHLLIRSISSAMASNFSRFAAVDHVGMVDPPHRPVRRNGDDVELVDLPELAGLGHGGAGHAADFVVQLEEVLQRDRGQRLRFFLDPHPFLGLDGLMQAVAPIAARHEAAGEFVDDDHLAVLRPRSSRRACRGDGPSGSCRSGAAIPCCRRCRSFPRRPASRPSRTPSSVRLTVCSFSLTSKWTSFFNCRAIASALAYLGHVVVGRAGDDQRRAGFVDQDVVDFVDDREMQRPLRLLHAAWDSDCRRGRRAACCRADSRSRIRCSCRR